MIMTMGIYEQAISITSRDRNVRRAAIIFLIPYGIGIVVGILGLAFIIKWLMDNHPDRIRQVYRDGRMITLGRLPAF